MIMSLRRIAAVLLFLSLAVWSSASVQAAEVRESASRYSVRIEMSQAYIGGICIVKGDESCLTASVVNEFGVSMVTFRYDLNKGKVKIVNCIRQLRRPFLRKVLKKDFRIILDLYTTFEEGNVLPIRHVNSKYNITYNFIPL